MVGALASLLAMIAANGTSQLDCVCSHISNKTDGGVALWADTVSVGERRVWDDYCKSWSYNLVESCETLEPSSPVLAVVARMAPWDWRRGKPPASFSLSWERDCGAALAAFRGLTREEAWQLPCHMADTLREYCFTHGLNETTWPEEKLTADHQKLSQSVHAIRSLAKAIHMVYICDVLTATTIDFSSQADLASYLELHSKHWRPTAWLLTVLVSHVSHLFVPLAFQHMGNHTSVQQSHGWIENVKRVKDMLDTKLRGRIHDPQFLSEQIPKYKVEEDKATPGKYKIRRPLLSEGLLSYLVRFLSFREDFVALCEDQLPQASHVFGLADALYFFSTPGWSSYKDNITVDEEWQLEDQSNTTVWVDTGCLQLLADAMDHSRCPLEELPLEASRQRRQCRQQLWRDLVERPPRPPVTSYLAYSERASVPLCLLAWMASNTRGVCQDVPFSIMQSVHDTTYYFDSPNNESCLQSNTTDAICSVSRAVLLLKCREFSSVFNPKHCIVSFNRTGHYSEDLRVNESFKVYGRASDTTMSYIESLNSVTLKYRNFKVEILKPLEYTFIAINVLFRFLTASVYMWLPHLRNLPGKILLSFQLTGLAQVLCSEVLYRMVGFPDLSTAVLVDSSLTLLSCLWLNTFCLQMYACVRDLRLPDHLTPTEASIVFRRQMWWAMMPWAIVSTACTALEKSSNYYLMHSRIIFIVAVSSSITLNLVLLGFVAYIYLRNKKSMRPLNIIGGDKGFSKKQLTFMSVNTIILSGICVMIRIGFHQAEGIAQYVYYVHIATMLQGPVLFVFLLCNGKTLPALKNRVLAVWRPDVYNPGLELGSAAKRNLARRRAELPPAAETSL